MKKMKLIGIIATILLLHPVAKSQDAANIERLLDNERYSSAEELLEKKIITDGTEPELEYLIIKTYLHQEKKEEVKAFVEKYQLSNDLAGAPLSRIAYARFLLMQGDSEGASVIFNSLNENKKNRKNVTLLMAMADACISEENGDAARALQWLQLAAKKDDNNPDVYLLMGRAYRKLSDASNAFLAYQQALKKDKKNIKAHYLMGKIFTAQKNPDVYMEHFEAAYSIDSTYAPVLEELYNHYYYKNPVLARKYLEKYIANTDYSLQNDYRLTDILYLTGDYDNAIASAKKILEREKGKAQPRLYKLMAYSSQMKGDTMTAIRYINDYFNKESTAKLIAPDFELRAQLTSTQTGSENEAATYYVIAAEMDSLAEHKVKYATEIVNLYKKSGEDSKRAHWLGKLYQWKETTNNIDLFNWGLAHYTAKEYLQTDSVFTLYSTRYPEDIYGYYWRAQANAAIDTSMTLGLAIPHYHKVVEIGSKKRKPIRICC